MDNQFVEMIAKPILSLGAVCICLFLIFIAMNLVDGIFDFVKRWWMKK